MRAKLFGAMLSTAVLATACASPAPPAAPPPASSPIASPGSSPTSVGSPKAVPAPGVIRYELPNLGVAVAVPSEFGVRTHTVDALPSVTPAKDVDVADYMGQLRLSPLLVSAVGGLGLVGYTADGQTLLTVAATQASDVQFDVEVPAGRAHIYPDEAPGDGLDTVSGYVELPADDFMLGVRARSSQLVSDDLEALVLAVLETTEILGAPATTQAAAGAGTGANVDLTFDAWIPDTLGDRSVAITALPGRYALAHPVFDGRTPSALALLCSSLAVTADEIVFIGGAIGSDSASSPAEIRGCRVAGATSAAWLKLLSPDLERVEGRLPVFRAPGDTNHARIVVAGQALLLITAISDELADRVVADLPETEIPADAPIGG